MTRFPASRPVVGWRRARWLRAAAVALVLAAGLVTAPTPGSGAPQPTAAHTVTFDRYSLKIDGKRLYLWSGEFAYWRLPSPSLWRDVLEKMKAAGYNAASIYFDWGYHSPAPGVYDFSGVRDVDRLLDIADQVGIYVIARQGPYINAETDGGGFPGWLNRMNVSERSPDPAYLRYADQWLSHIDPIIARHQLTNGTGTVILDQVENEFYDGSASGREYMQHLENKYRADGITVPLTGNHNGTFNSGAGAVDIDGWDAYPQGFGCNNPNNWRRVPDYSSTRDSLTDRPLYFPEYQGGSFDRWGSVGYDDCRQMTDADFEKVFYDTNIAAGSTMQSFYMTYGGTSWGYLPYPYVYTSYDYGAAIAEDRELTDKYQQQKLTGYFLSAVPSLTKTDTLSVAPPSNRALWLRARVNPDDGTQLYVLRHRRGPSTADDSTHLAIGDYPRVPQQPGTTIAVNGRDAKMLLANYTFGDQRMMYSTSQLMTDATIGDRDVALLYDPRGEDGETVLRYGSRPTVTVLSGSVRSTWDSRRGDLRLDYTHDGLARVRISGGGRRDAELLLADTGTAKQFWRQDTSAGPVLVRGPALLRTASYRSGTLALTGDTDASTGASIWAPPAVRSVTWNGTAVRASGGTVRTATLPGPKPVSMPALSWRSKAENPEAAPGFDDSNWTRADRTTTQNPAGVHNVPVLYADDYGYHHGNVWYRGHFTATGHERSIRLDADTGNSTGQYSVWLNGHYLGTANRRHGFAVPRRVLKTGKDNVLAVLVANMGHDEGTGMQPRGLVSARLLGSSAGMTWRIQGDRGGEDPIDPVRGPLNNGGLYGERAGWSLPGYPDASWRTAHLPQSTSTPGITWYRSEFHLAIPAGQDVPVALRFADDASKAYRVQIFLNGWNMGLYVNNVGPQHDFQLPTGLLDPRGHNTLALAVWSADGSSGLGNVSLVAQANLRGGVPVSTVDSPPYDPARY